MKQSCLLGEMFYGSLSQEMFEVYFSAENKSSMIRRDDLKMIWWLVLFLQNLLQIFNFNILFPKHDNLKCPFVCDLYYMIHLILYI